MEAPSLPRNESGGISHRGTAATVGTVEVKGGMRGGVGMLGAATNEKPGGGQAMLDSAHGWLQQQQQQQRPSDQSQLPSS